MASIETRKRGKGVVYRVVVRIKGHPRMQATFDRKSDAIRWGEDVEHALIHGLPLPGEELPTNDISIKDAVEEYLHLMEKVKNRSRHTVQTDGWTGKRLIDRFGTLSLRTLRREDIEEYRDDRLHEVGPSSVRHDLSMLSRIYETARIKWRFEQLDNPGRDVKLPPPPPNRKRIIADFQIPPLLAECKKSKNKKLYPLVVLLLSTGMRPAEAVLMRWRQVLWAEGVISLPTTKTAPRRVPVSDDCLQMLGEMRGDAGEHDLIFTDEKNAGRDKPVRFYRRAFEQACVRAKINQPKKRDVSTSKAEALIEDDDPSRVTLYTLRHSAATYLIMHGVDIRSVADILGHSNISQTMRYTHVVDDHKRKAVSNPNLPWNKIQDT